MDGTEYYYSTGKICTFALTRGIELNGATQEEIARATILQKHAWLMMRFKKMAI